MRKSKINISGFKIGTAENRDGLTGVTVILAPDGGATAGVDVRGCAPGTRETDLLDPRKTVQKIHAVVLSGGSAFGLEAASGCVKYLAEQGVGFPIGNVCVPIVCSAVLFDLMIGDEKAYPDLLMGYEAAKSASSEFLSGCNGAGTGATVGKLLGFGNAMKSGAGYHEISLPGGLRVGAYVVVNACGEVFDGEKIFAGVFSRSRKKIISSHELMLSGITREFSGANTTIACVITNAALSKAECSIVSGMAHDGYARSIRPVHTTMDGDAIFTMASGEYETAVDTVGYLAEDAIRLAVIDAIKMRKLWEDAFRIMIFFPGNILTSIPSLI